MHTHARTSIHSFILYILFKYYILIDFIQLKFPFYGTITHSYRRRVGKCGRLCVEKRIKNTHTHIYVSVYYYYDYYHNVGGPTTKTMWLSHSFDKNVPFSRATLIVASASIPQIIRESET